MTRPDHDVVILGGGLAGLSVAARLARDAPHVGALVVEGRPAYRRDRTWCSWRLHGHPFADAVARSWDRWAVLRPDGRGGATETVQAHPATPYDMIPADRLYDAALGAIERAPNVRLLTSCAVGAVAEGPEGVTVETGAGPVAARYVLDGRPPAVAPDALRQRFLGQEVAAASPVFDPSVVTLMDFAVDQLPGAVRFLYVLPISDREALVEDTWLAPAGMPLPDHRAAIRAYLDRRFGLRDYAVLFEEDGAIPMDPDLQGPAEAGRVVPIGAAGGAIKPSSGYGFLAIQRQADAIAADLAAGRPPRPVRTRGPAAAWMDAVLLNALKTEPERAPDLFGALFERCAPGPLLRFLNDVGSVGDAARVIAAMPKTPMMAAALRTPRPRLAFRRASA